ncbi:MAG: ABC transporter substrate-binding protein [Deltaproteobacteria bacterium]|nr:ABC transporter substrate-binding protein [Deltaproteobacteria bacterium]
MKRLWISGAVVLLILVTVIFLRPNQSESPPPELKVGVLKHESSLPIYVADELGLFAHAGISVQLVEVPPGDHMPALISKRVDILSPTSFPVLFGVMGKNPGLLYAVFPGAEVANGPTVYGFIVSKDSRASGLNDLRGKVLMSINPYTKMNIQTILSSAGIPKEEWPEIKVAARETALKAISDGQADAAIMDQPALAVAVASGDYRLLEANPRAKYIGTPYWSGSGAVLTQNWRDKKASFAKLMYAIDEAIKEINRDPNAAHKILAKRLGLDQGIANQMGGYYFPTSIETVDLAGIEATVGALVNAGLLDQPIGLKGFFPPSTYGTP